MTKGGEPDSSILETPQPNHRKKKKKTYQFSTRKAIARAVERKKEGLAGKIGLRTVVEEFDGAVKRLDFTGGTVHDEDPHSFSEMNEDHQKASWALTLSDCFCI